MGKRSYGYGYYAVRKGRKIGVFRSWAQCEEQVKGYSGAQHKRFDSEEAAWEFVRQGNNQDLNTLHNSTSHRIGYGNALLIQGTPRVNGAFPSSDLQYHKGKFYAVKAGRKPGIYLTWEECQEQVIGFSGARFKSFKSLEEAENFVHFGMYDPFINPIIEEPLENFLDLNKNKGGSRLTKLTLSLGPSVSSASIPRKAVETSTTTIPNKISTSSTVKEGQQTSDTELFWDNFQSKFTALNRKRLSDEAFGSNSMIRWDEYERLSETEDEPVKTHLKASREDDNEDEVVFVKQTKKRKGH